MVRPWGLVVRPYLGAEERERRSTVEEGGMQKAQGEHFFCGGVQVGFDDEEGGGGIVPKVGEGR